MMNIIKPFRKSIQQQNVPHNIEMPKQRKTAPSKKIPHPSFKILAAQQPLFMISFSTRSAIFFVVIRSIYRQQSHPYEPFFRE